ncbi:MAG: hypothetical protein CM15mP45_14050 [Deltaproteobacteria bacterium]|nr:MAG: hypothetical protein CM15mP45_14050 [Deltaproteobacteria bacterium]
MLVEDFGNRNKQNNSAKGIVQQHLQILPRRRNQFAIYRDKSFHELFLGG